ncbi:hypothetical protein POVWA2_044540 [Plasmodium ovale wallikeri]|uniref:Uncharacterized protein n=1 Tax=Plasmodium ovale wallikeri TaxID=864142 RepID=A0A1A8ZF15_PLAOA|nr:hypothetical protein POVWA1_045970 [Plasmodium ovale wallikeri]SBT42755.1 hypothetical protein POVWA2_044540 [Plasmodium ovale wallikeri]
MRLRRVGGRRGGKWKKRSLVGPCVSLLPSPIVTHTACGKTSTIVTPLKEKLKPCAYIQFYHGFAFKKEKCDTPIRDYVTGKHVST